MRFYLALLATALLAVPAVAQPWFARGDFNGWSTDNPMEVDPLDSTHYTAAITGLFDDSPYMYKLAVEDWSINMPSSNGRVYTDALGGINFHLWDQTTWSDGWFPNNVRRVGYDDHQQFDWEIVGSFNGWSGTHDSAYALTDLGNGLHSGTFAFNAGIHDFKFRGVGADPVNVWDTSIGNDFGNSAGNNQLAVTANGQQWTVELDLPNGRWRAFTAAPPTQPGDHNRDGAVNAADYPAWRKVPGMFDGDPTGYNTWRENFGEGAQPELTWIARGTDAGDTWQETLTDPNNDGIYTVTRSGLTPGEDRQLQVLRSDVSAIVPGNPGVKVRADAGGNITLNFYELEDPTWSDGWNPDNQHRIGYVDHNLFDWEIVGSFNGWPGASDPAYALTDGGGGLHANTFTFPTPGDYVFKFRHIDPTATDNWSTAIGQTFNNAGGDIPFTIVDAGDQWRFELDLPGGRWRAFEVAPSGGSVPEPGSLVLIMLGALFATVCHRRE